MLADVPRPQQAPTAPRRSRASAPCRCTGAAGLAMGAAESVRDLVAAAEGPEEITILDLGQRAAAVAARERVVSPGGTEVLDRQRAQVAQVRRLLPDVAEALRPEVSDRRAANAAGEHLAVGAD